MIEAFNKLKKAVNDLADTLNKCNDELKLYIENKSKSDDFNIPEKKVIKRRTSKKQKEAAKIREAELAINTDTSNAEFLKVKVVVQNLTDKMNDATAVQKLLTEDFGVEKLSDMDALRYDEFVSKLKVLVNAK